MDSKSLILIAEDTEEDGLMLCMALKRAGLQNPTHVCTDGEDLTAYLKGAGPYTDREKYPLPRMLLLDLKMPRMNGFEVLRWIKKNPECSVTPTIILSSSTLPSDVEEGYRLGANAYLAKPALLGDLQDVLHQLHAFFSSCELPELRAKPQVTEQSQG